MPIPEKLKNIITSVEISKIPDGHNTMCYGRENVFIDFYFDVVISSDESDERMVVQLLKKKENAIADTLLIWYCDKDFWGKGQKKQIYKLFEKNLDKCHFNNVYLFFFIDAEKLFDVNKKVYVLREKIKHL